MGQFTKRSPLGKGKGAPKPWPRPTRVRIYGGMAWPHPWPLQPLLLPLAAAIGLPWWRGKVHPSLLYKGGPLEEEMHNTIHEPLHLAALLHPWCTGHTLPAALSLSHSCMASRRDA
jgi:hypothetical protein